METVYVASKGTVTVAVVAACTAAVICYAAGVYAGWKAHKETLKQEANKTSK